MNKDFIKRILQKFGRESAKYVGKKTGFLPSGNRIVSFTFDDFPFTAIENGARLLEAHKMRGTFYCSLGLAKTNTHVGLIGTEKDMLAVSEHGHECGCHTFEHIDCAEKSSKAILDDCLRNQSAAKRIANIQFHSFAYPRGSFNPSSKRVVSSLYRSARTIEPGINVNKIDLFALRSIALSEVTGLERIRAWLRKLDKSGGWLIFRSHDVTQAPSRFGCSTRLFERILEETLDKRFQVKTIVETTNTFVRIT